MKILIGLGIFVLTVLLASEAFVRIYDGEVFELPDHYLVISDNGFHFYQKRITFTFEADEKR